jgi:hypothetical protein
MPIALVLAVAASLQPSVDASCPKFAPSAANLAGGPMAYTVMGGNRRTPPPSRHTPVPTGPGESAIMTLSRSGCYGSCPAYRVEVRGDGAVRFNGEGSVLLAGEHTADIDPKVAGCLLEAFRKADFWSLNPRYVARAFDLPTYRLTLSIGGKSKTVIDFAGRVVGMPAEVTSLEDAVDSAAGTGRWITGEPGMIDLLAQEHFDFHSKAAALLALKGVHTASDDTLVELVDRGAALDVEIDSSQPNSPKAGTELLRGAILNGKTALFRKLVERGWLATLGLSNANKAFAEGSGGCQPAFVDAAVAAGLDVNAATPLAVKTATDEDKFGMTALAGLATDYGCPDEVARVATAERLLAHGANPNLRNSEGKTSIFGVENIDLLNLLLSHGSDASVRDKKGSSAVFDTWTDAIVLRLLEAGASPEGVYFDGKTLREQAKERHMPNVERWLDHQNSSQSVH